MKIGKFVKHNNITIDAVRHYMDLGLLIPEKQGSQYDFDSRCQEDLNDIIDFKGMGFSLNEIKSILMYKRLGQLTQYQEDEIFRNFFINKAKQLEREIVDLNKMRAILETKLSELPTNTSERKTVIGVDFRVLQYLKCLECSSDLYLREGNIENNQIINGKLRCNCGQEYLIEDGIIMIGKSILNDEHTFDYNYITDYINSTNTNYLDNVYNGIEWMYKKIDFAGFKNKLLLEFGSGVGFFLRAIYQDLPDDAIYFAVDHDINRHIFLKQSLEKLNYRKNIVFICGDFKQIPIKDKSVDIVLDISGTSNYSFNHSEFLLSLVDNYIKDNARIFASYILFKNFTANSSIEDKYKKNFLIKNVKEQILNLKYNIYDESISSPMDKGGKYEDYFKEGEKVYSYLIFGKR